MYILRYCSNSWFVFSVYLSVCRWKAVDSFVSIPNILFNFFINFVANWGSLSEIIHFGNLYNFHTLFLNNFAKLFTIIIFIITIKYNIFENLLHTTKIESWSLDIGNFIIKSTNICYHSFSSIVFSLNFLAGISILFFILWH